LILTRTTCENSVWKKFNFVSFSSEYSVRALLKFFIDHADDVPDTDEGMQRVADAITPQLDLVGDNCDDYSARISQDALTGDYDEDDSVYGYDYRVHRGTNESM